MIFRPCQLESASHSPYRDAVQSVYLIATPHIFDAIQQSMRIVENVLGLEGGTGVVPVRPDSGVDPSRVVLDLVEEKVAKPYTARLGVLLCLCGSTIQSMKNEYP